MSRHFAVGYLKQQQAKTPKNDHSDIKTTEISRLLCGNERLENASTSCIAYMFVQYQQECKIRL